MNKIFFKNEAMRVHWNKTTRCSEKSTSGIMVGNKANKKICVNKYRPDVCIAMN